MDKLNLIAACGQHDRVIGVAGELPWHLPADLRHFKALTMGCPVIMGRKTHESIGRALPGRRNIIVSRQPREWAGCEAASSIEAALQMVADAEQVFVIGGGELYAQTLPLAQCVYLTEVDADTPAGDAFFPMLPPDDWREDSREAHAAEAYAAAGAGILPRGGYVADGAAYAAGGHTQRLRPPLLMSQQRRRARPPLPLCGMSADRAAAI